MLGHIFQGSRVRVPAMVATLSVVFIGGDHGLFAQARSPTRPAFEVASVKEGDPRGSITGSASGRRWMWENFALRDAITAAFHIGYWQLSGAPDWDDERFRIDALMPEGSAIHGFPLNDDRLMSMLQTLLEDRFKLSYHWRTKQARGYTLVIAKKGSKLTPTTTPPENSFWTGAVAYGGGQIRGNYATMTHLTRALSAMLQCPVSDRTGMKGNYEFVAHYSRKDDETPSVFSALEDQLGLRLEAGMAEAQILVVDHVEKPTPN